MPTGERGVYEWRPPSTGAGRSQTSLAAIDVGDGEIGDSVSEKSLLIERG